MRPGITLLELVVVLSLLALATGLVAPALLPDAPREPDAAEVLRMARQAALRRGEPLTFQLDARTGRWRLDGDGDPAPVATGRLAGPVTEGFTLRISALGTCGVVPGAGRAGAVDPLSCLPGGG